MANPINPSENTSTGTPPVDTSPVGTPPVDTAPPVVAPDTEILFEEPYKRLVGEFQALSVDELVVINLDIPSAVTTVLGCQPEILGLAPQIAKELPEFALERIKKIDEYAMALSHAHTLYLMASQPPDALTPLVEEGTKLRERLFADASALVLRGLMNGNRLKDLQGPKGFKNLAVDLQILAALFRESFAQVEGKCGTQLDELLRAEQIAARVLRTVGLREQGSALIAATSDMRIRAFTLFTRYYDQARRAVLYLRWSENDADTIAPSLFQGRGGRKKVATDVSQPTPPTGTVPVVPGSPANGGQPAAATPAAPHAGAIGTPSAEPFLS